MKKILTLNQLNGLLISLLLLTGIWGCRKEKLVYQTTSDVNITSYLEKYPATFSEFRKILDITGNASYLNALGAYTLFAPTNDAINQYLKDLGKTSVDQVDVQVLKDMVRFHLLSDTIRSSQFTDGKLSSLTMLGQYLITGAKNVAGVTKIVINRQANVIQSDISVGNGIIHSIDHVLTPAKYTVAQLIENDPRYSIFTQLIKATGFYDTLNILPDNNPNTKQKYLTVLAESDSVLKVAGFNDYNSLKAKYSNTGDPKNPLDSLRLFAAYHIIYDAKYVADIAMSSSQATLAPLEIVSASLKGTTLLINDVTFLGIYEPGAPIDRPASDNSATNGVLNSVSQHYVLKIRKPVRVDWDLCAVPEMIKNTAIYRHSSTIPKYNENSGNPFADITWDPVTSNGMSYTWSILSTMTRAAMYCDTWILQMGAGRPMWYEFKSPIIVRGKYKVWIGYRYQRKSTGSLNIDQVLIDGVALPTMLEFTTWMPDPKVTTDAAMEAQGWKQYSSYADRNFSARLIGTIDIKTTDRHILRLQNVTGSQDVNNLDLVQFIPVDQDQIWPRINPLDGSLQPKP